MTGWCRKDWFDNFPWSPEIEFVSSPYAWVELPLLKNVAWITTVYQSRSSKKCSKIVACNFTQTHSLIFDTNIDTQTHIWFMWCDHPNKSYPFNYNLPLPPAACLFCFGITACHYESLQHPRFHWTQGLSFWLLQTAGGPSWASEKLWGLGSMKKHRAPNMGVSKNRGIYPEMDGKNNGKPY